MKVTAKKVPGFLAHSVIYQIHLRAFTLDGTLKAAERMLPHIASLGADIVYLCPVVKSDDDSRREFWSDRQNRSGLENPNNPYRISDYFAIDPEYGTVDDLKSFIACAHSLHLRVMLDLVYYHCGPTAVFIDTHPDFVKREADGSVKNGTYHFPELNFESQGLRNYLLENMEYFVREFDIDGYRCDVAGAVPLDLWEEARRRIEAVRPDFIMLSETLRPEPQEQVAAFDISYGALHWVFGDALLGKRPFSAIREEWEKEQAKLLAGARLLGGFDNHDVANDQYDERAEKMVPERIESALAMTFAYDGIPFLYNGQEIADSRKHSIFGNRFYGKNLVIDWSNSQTPQGVQRLNFVRELIALRRSHPALHSGKLAWQDSPSDELILFQRESPEETIHIAINFSNSPQAIQLKGNILFGSSGATCLNLPPHGFIIVQ